MTSPSRCPSPHSSASKADFLRRTHLHHNGQRRSRSRHSTASPSPQLAEEFSRVYISGIEEHKRSLDLQITEQERLHLQALSKSLKEHEAVRESAERARLRVELEIERERRRREEEERLKLEETRRKAEQDEQDRKKEADRIRKLAEELAKQREQDEARQQEEARQKGLQADAKKREQAAKEQQEKEAKASREAAQRKAVEKVRSTPIQPPPLAHPQLPDSAKTLAILSPQGISTSAEQREAEHKRYLQLHKRLKEMRKHVLNEASKHPGLKNKISDMRRVIQKSLSIVNAVDKTKNVKPTADINATLKEASQMQQISLSPTPFIVQETAEGQYPGALLFLLNYFAKYTILRFTDQVSRDAKAAEPYGILVAHVFANPLFHFNDHSLIDILWAKYHKVCPTLFGINGNEKTVIGKQRLGWRFERDFTDPTTGSFVTAEEHLSYQCGLAAGFASITLRDFSRSKSRNPAPNRLYWSSLARVLSTPPADRTTTHYVVVRNMIEHSIPRFVLFFGGAALAAMRTVFKDWPRQAVNKSEPNVLALDGMTKFLERDYNLYL